MLASELIEILEEYPDYEIFVGQRRIDLDNLIFFHTLEPEEVTIRDNARVVSFDIIVDPDNPDEY